MSKVRDISGLANIIKTDANGNVTFVSGSTTLMAISSSGAVTSTGTIGGSNSATLATTGSNTFTGQQYVSNTNAPVNFTDTASLYTDGGLRVGKDAYVSGTLYLNNLTVYGTQSVNFITSSQLDIADNIITVNTSTPAIRFGGIAVRDSGSLGTGLTGSLLWDSQNNHWVYTNPSGSSYSGGMMISGPRASSLGEEQGTTFNALMKGQGGDHITSSGIFESGSNVGIGTSSPSRLLNISGVGTDGTQVQINGTGDSAGIKLIPVSGDNWEIQANTSNQFFIYNRTDNANRLSIDGSGNLQLGSVLNSGAATSTPIVMGFGSTFGNNPTGSNFKLKLFEDTTPNIYGLGISNSLFEIVAGNAAAMGFFTNGSEKMRITSAGNIGIGNITPQATLHLGPSLNTVPASTSIAVAGDTSIRFMAGSDGNANYGSYIAGTQTAGVRALSFGYRQGAGDVLTMTITQISDGKGGVGIGTSVPTSPLTVRSTSRGDILRLSISGSSSAGDATGITFGSATYDKAQIIAYNENTGNAAGYLTFWTGGSPATTDMTERMRLKSDGSVYIGGTSMANSQKFGIIGSGVWDGATLGLQNTGAGGNTYTIFSTNNQFSQGASNLLFYYNGGPTNNLIIYANGNYDFLGSDVSDRRLKQDIENISFGLNEIMALSPKSYHLKSSDNLSGENQTTLRKRHGFIAQEVQSILPDTITGTETETEYLGLDYNGVLAVAVKAIQELKAENDTLKEILQRNNIQ